MSWEYRDEGLVWLYQGTLYFFLGQLQCHSLLKFDNIIHTPLCLKKHTKVHFSCFDIVGMNW